MKKSALLCLSLCLSLPHTTITKDSPTEKSSQSKKGDSFLAENKNIDLGSFKKDSNNILYKITQTGSGPKAISGETLTVHYTGNLLHNNVIGKEFDSSVKRGKPFQFKLGGGQVISGWDLSLAEMKEGEKRIIILSPDKAYGSRAQGTIPANSTLIFEIEFISAE